jgi:hypothetical protein
MVASSMNVRVVREQQPFVMAPSLELEFLTTRPKLEWNEHSFYDELNGRLRDAGTRLSVVLERSKERIAQAGVAQALARPAGSRERHFNADPIDRTHVILHSSFHVLEAQGILSSKPAAAAPEATPAAAD